MEQIKQDLLCEKIHIFFKDLYNPQLVTSIQMNILKILEDFVIMLKKGPSEISSQYKIEGHDLNHGERYNNAYEVYKIIKNNVTIGNYVEYCKLLQTLPPNKFIYIKGIYEEILRYANNFR